MQCLIEDLGFDKGEGLTIISDQHKGILEDAKMIMLLAEHRQCARHIYANFRKRYTGVLFKNLFWKSAKATYPARFEKAMNEIKELSKEAHAHLMQRNPQSWSRAFFTTDTAYDAVENGISECFNSLIVEARRKTIINMLEDIRIGLMERMQKMREKHAKWVEVICPNIKKKLEIAKEHHKNWKVVASGQTRFEVRNGYEGFKVDEGLRTCSCRGWQLTGIPCQHGLAVIYFLHKTPEEYLSDWYNKDRFVVAYSHYIQPMNGMDQWPTTSYEKPLPPIKRRMPGRPPHKRKVDASEYDGNRSRVSRKGQVNHCKLCLASGHNQRSCPTKSEGSAGVGENTGGVGERSSSGSRGGRTGSGSRGGRTENGSRGGRNGSGSRGGMTGSGSTGGRTGRGSRGGRTGSGSRGGRTPTCNQSCIPSVGFEISTSPTTEGVRVTKSGVKIRGGIGKSPTKFTINGKVIRHKGKGKGPNGFGVSWDPIDGEPMLGNRRGLPRPAWPVGITPEDAILHAQQTEEEKITTLSASQPMPSQDEDSIMHDEAPMGRRTSQRLMLKNYNKKQEDGPGLTEDDAISIE